MNDMTGIPTHNTQVMAGAALTLDAQLLQATWLGQAVLKRAFEGRME